MGPTLVADGRFRDPAYGRRPGDRSPGAMGAAKLEFLLADISSATKSKPQISKVKMKRPRSPITLLLVSAVTLGVLAPSAMAADAGIPFVYSAENTGAHHPAPVFPSFDWLPIVRPLPDPFRFFDGTRDTSFESWERRRNEIRASIEHWEIGPKPLKSDLTVEATYTPPAAGANAGGCGSGNVQRQWRGCEPGFDSVPPGARYAEAQNHRRRGNV